MRLPAAVVAERDERIYQMKLRGASFRQIAQALDIAVQTAHSGYMRHLKKEAKLSAEQVHDGVFMQLARYENIIAGLFPMTKEREVMVDGVPIKVPPSMDAIDRMMKAMAAENKILGYEKDTVSLTVGGGNDGPDINSDKEAGERTPEIEARDFASELLKHGVLGGAQAEALTKMLSLSQVHKDAVEAEVVDDSFEILELEEADLPPAWVDDDDDEYIPGAWRPDDMLDGDDLNGNMER